MRRPTFCGICTLSVWIFKGMIGFSAPHAGSFHRLSRACALPWASGMWPGGAGFKAQDRSKAYLSQQTVVHVGSLTCDEVKREHTSQAKWQGTQRRNLAWTLGLTAVAPSQIESACTSWRGNGFFCPALLSSQTCLLNYPPPSNAALSPPSPVFNSGRKQLKDSCPSGLRRGRQLCALEWLPPERAGRLGHSCCPRLEQRV